MWSSIWNAGSSVAGMLMGRGGGGTDDGDDDEDSLDLPENAQALSKQELAKQKYKERVLQDSSLREVDWERVLRAVKEDDLFTASDLLTADKELEKALLNVDNGATLKERMVKMSRDNIFRCTRHDKHEDAAKFAVIYKHLEGDLAVVLDFLIDQSLIKLRANHERVMKDIQTMIDAKLKAAVAAPSTETINIVEALGKLFDSVKKVFEQYNYIEQVFNVSSYMIMMVAHQKTCDDFAVALMDSYLTYRNIANLILGLKQGVTKVENPTLLSSIVDDVLALERHCYAYKVYLRKTFELCVNKLRDRGVTFFDGTVEKREREGPLRLNIVRYVAEPERSYTKASAVLECYRELEVLYVVHVVNKLIDQESAVSSENGGSEVAAKTSVLIEDVFSVLQTAFHRATVSLSLPVVANVVGAVSNYLSQQFSARFKKRLLLAMRGGSALNEETATDWKLAAIRLNDVFLSSKFASSLYDSLVTSIGKMAALSEADDREAQALACTTHASAFNRSFQTLQDECQALFLRPLLADLFSHVRGFARTGYQLDGDDYKALQNDDMWVGPLCHQVESTLALLSNLLVDDAMSAMSVKIVSDVLREIEDTVAVKTFNQLGGLQFGNDMQRLFEFIAQQLQVKGASEKFVRLLEIKDLLALDKVTEAAELWKASEEHKWLLSEVEVRKFLRRRTEFSETSVSRLKL